MGAYVSNWKLASTVAANGGVGVVSGTAVDNVLARILQNGDPGGHYRRALAHFPDQAAAQDVVAKYYVEAASEALGSAQRGHYRAVEMHSLHPSPDLLKLTVLANFCEVWLAKQGHDGLVGINLLAKIELPTLPSLYGAILAGGDFVIMGAGIPKSIPAALDRLSQHSAATIPLRVEGAEASEFESKFDPTQLFHGCKFLSAPLHRPRFLPVVSSLVLAKALIKSCGDGVDGFVVEMNRAGGHNAPPRGKQLSDTGEPVYGDKDTVDLEKFGELGKPFWVAGGYGTPEELRKLINMGAQGVQVDSNPQLQ